MTNILWQNKNIMSVVFLFLMPIFELIQQTALVSFAFFLNILEILKTSF